jgi:membrane-bound metal-dependent hydrolase YbcI (DUF457 family)
MDNLAHSLVGAVVAATVAPRVATSVRRRLIWTSVLIVNLPDLDFLLYLIDPKVYFFHHRGFTHSIFGFLVCMFPLSLWLTRKLIVDKMPVHERHHFPVRDQVFFVILQLCFSHYFLDYLTTYGNMIFYPFTMDRFAFPLMFIIDPLLWLLGIAGCVALYLAKNRQPRMVKLIGTVTMGSVLILWGVEMVFKNRAERDYRETLPDGVEEVLSFPMAGAPLNWNLLAIDRKRVASYTQATRSYWPNTGTLKNWYISSAYRHESFCDSAEFSETAHKEWRQFSQWSLWSICKPMVYEKRQGCRCVPLKYGIGTSEINTFGTYFIDHDGVTTELPQASGEEMSALMKEVMGLL